MFKFFRKDKAGIKINDKIWMTSNAKWNALINQYSSDQDTVFVFWFDETLREVEKYIEARTSINYSFQLARSVPSAHLMGKKIVFAEHYPLINKEQELFTQLGLEEVQVWSALDEPLFKKFGSDKIIKLMKQMGAKEDEVIEHNMISKAIQAAQEKISKKVLLDQSCTSQEEWLRRNWNDN
jgi:hypothetical protein